MTTAEKTYTITEFMALPDDGKRYELWEGHLEEKMSPVSGDHGRIGARLIMYLSVYVKQHKPSGVVFSDSVPFAIDTTTNTYFSPDVAYVVAGRITGALPGAVPFPPDLAVEILSKHDYEHSGKFKKKIAAYQRAGTRLIWAVDVRSNSVRVYRLDQPTPDLYTIDDVIRGEDVIPGFEIEARSLFYDE